MGIDYDGIAVFGVFYNLSELENYMEHQDSDEFDNAIEKWENMGNCYEIAKFFPTSSPYFDSDHEDRIYYIGIQLERNGVTKISDLNEILEKEQQIRKIIRDFSEKYHIENKENEIGLIVSPDIW